MRFVHQGRREHFSLKVTRRDLAEKEAGEINDLLEAGQWSKIRNRAEARHRTFSEVTTEFLTKGNRWSESTLKGCSASLNRLLSEFGELALTDIDAGLIEAYIARRRDEGRSKGTRNRELAIVKAILKKAFEWGYVAHNAAADVTTERQGKKTPQPYMRDELARLLAELQPRHRSIATLYLHTALRRSELMKLRWADVDWEVQTLTVRAPKNDDDRTIPLSPKRCTQYSSNAGRRGKGNAEQELWICVSTENRGTSGRCSIEPEFKRALRKDGDTGCNIACGTHVRRLS